MDPEKIRTVYDVSLVAGVTPGSAPPTLTSAINGRETEAHMYIRKFSLQDIPKVLFLSFQRLNSWTQVDKRLDSFAPCYSRSFYWRISK
jgi:hypothetical protein